MRIKETYISSANVAESVRSGEGMKEKTAILQNGGVTAQRERLHKVNYIFDKL